MIKINLAEYNILLFLLTRFELEKQSYEQVGGTQSEFTDRVKQNKEK
jgi:hypothetical protein